VSYSAIIDRLTEDIRQYRIESQRFFTGDSQVPPEELRVQIRRDLTSLIGRPQLSPVEQFRLGALESRYHSLTELFRRRLRGQDQAKYTAAEAAEPERDEERAAAPGSPGAGRPSAGSSGASSASAVELGRDSGVEDVEALFEALYGSRGTRAEHGRGIDIGSFHAYLADQASEMRERTGCDKVRFSVDAGSGEPRLKARPVRSSARSADG
jgi:hypothetical protein